MRQKSYFQRIWKSQLGFGVMEGVIAMAILLIVAYFVADWVSAPAKTGQNLRSLAECQNFVNSLMTDIKSRDNKIVVRNNFVNASRPGETQIAVTNPLFNGTANSPVFQNIDGLVTRLYRNVPRLACTTPGGIPVRTDNAVNPSVRASDIFSSDSVIQDNTGNFFNVFFSMIGTDLDTGVSNCTNIDNIQSIGATAVAGMRNIAIDFTIAAQYTDETGATRSCQTNNRAAYDRDATLPTLTTTLNANGGNAVFGNTLNGGSAAHQPIPNTQVNPFDPDSTNTVCNPTNAANGGVWMNLTSSEAGSIFICRSGNNPGWPDASWQNCAGFQFPTAVGISGQLDAPTPAEGAPFSTNLRFVGLPEGQYELTVAVMDTSGNLSAQRLYFRFTVDLNRPTWAGALSRTNNVVNRADGFPIGSPNNAGFSAAHAALFGAQLYQCNLNSAPQFEGSMTPMVLLNERCAGRTYGTGVNDNIPGTGGVLAGTDDCRFTVTPTPSFQSGEIEFRAELRDVCLSDGDAVVPAAIATVDWVIDSPTGPANPLGSQISAVHTPVSFNGPVEQPYVRAALPTYRADYTRVPAVLNNYPIVWDVARVNDGGTPRTLKAQAISGGGNPAAASATSFTPAELNLPTGEAGSCNYGGGFCAVAFSPCGQVYASDNLGRTDNSIYAIRGQIGDSCNRVPCEAGLQCGYMDFQENTGFCASRTAFSCTAANQWRCTNHSDCTGSGNECFTAGGAPLDWDNTVFNAGFCIANVTRICGADGDCVTREGQIGSCVGGLCSCPDETARGSTPALPHATCTYPYSAAGSYCPQAAPNCTCNALVASTMCPADSFANSCGVLNACRGTNNAACASTGYTPFLDISCRLSPTDINIWLGARTDQDIFQASGVAQWASGGFAPYIYTCSTTSNAGPWGTCNYGSWAESPVYNASPWLNYWVRVEDSRGDYEICGGQYKLDRTPPTFSVAPSIPACGRDTAPTLSTQVQTSYTITDSHSDTAITSRNTTYSQVGAGCTQCVNNEVACIANCNNVNVPVTNDRNNNASQEIELTATDQAGNTTSRTTLAYAAANSGLALALSAGQPYTNTGCATCGSAPYNQGITGTISNTNAHNYHTSMTILRNPGDPLSYTPASWPGGVNSSIRFNSENVNTISIQFRDSCGNTSTNASANLVLDWMSPQLSGNCDYVGESIGFTGFDSRSGMQSITMSCIPSGASSSGLNSAGVGPLEQGVMHTCEANATDNAGNSTDIADGYGVTRTESVLCYFPQDCPLPATLGGGVISHGDTVSAFLEEQTLDDACSSIVRTCVDGTLEPVGSSYVYSSCNGRCTNPLGGILNNGESANPVYQSLTVPFSSTCQSESRTCNNGTLSGSYTHATCNRDCQSPWGTAVAHGASIQGYSDATVPSGQTCASRLGTMTCNNGTLSNDTVYVNQYCYHDCDFNGTNVAHNSSVTAYSSNSVACTESCAPLAASRTCTDGNLGGPFSHSFSSCSQDACIGCTSPNGNHGDVLNGYEETTPTFSSGCNAVSATCTNGSWVGTIPEGPTCNAICSVAGNWSCGAGRVLPGGCPDTPGAGSHHAVCGNEIPDCKDSGGNIIPDECCGPGFPGNCGRCVELPTQICQKKSPLDYLFAKLNFK